jgi:hypothetical protein
LSTQDDAGPGDALTAFLTDLGPGLTDLLRDQPYRASDMLILDTHNGARKAHRGHITWIEKMRNRYRVGVALEHEE